MEFEKLVEKHGINFNSPSGSRYVTTKNGVYRYSNHWGNVASCKWIIKAQPRWIKREKAYFLAYIKYSDLRNIR